MVVRKLKKQLYPRSEKHYQYLADVLYTPLKYKENSILMFPPLYGRDHTIQQMWERIQDRQNILGEKINDFHFAQINLTTTENNNELIWLEQIERTLCISQGKLGNFDEFIEHIKDLIDENIDLALFINIPETLDDDQFIQFLELAQKIYYISPTKIHFLLIFDIKWEEDHFFNLTTAFRSLFQNTKLLPLYPDKETRHFIKYCSILWKLTISNKIEEYLIQQSGGIFLLAKSALRIARNEKLRTLEEYQNIISTHPDNQLQIKFFLSRLTNRQQSILKQISNLEDVDDSEVNHLECMGIVRKDIHGWKIRSIFIQNFLSERNTHKDKKIKIIKVNATFSEREKNILLKLLNRSGTIISRESIAEIIWGADSYDKYSDWAIDQSISRIRKKVISIPQLSGLIIQTHKKYGFSVK